jgi:hypothetical protein
MFHEGHLPGTNVWRVVVAVNGFATFKKFILYKKECTKKERKKEWGVFKGLRKS